MMRSLSKLFDETNSRIADLEAQMAALEQQNGSLHSEIVYQRKKLVSEFSTNDKLRSGNPSNEELHRKAKVAGDCDCVRNGLASRAAEEASEAAKCSDIDSERIKNYTHEAFIDKNGRGPSDTSHNVQKLLIDYLFEDTTSPQSEFQQSDLYKCKITASKALLIATLMYFTNFTRLHNSPRRWEWDFGLIMASVLKCLSNSQLAVNFLAKVLPGTLSDQKYMRKMEQFSENVNERRQQPRQDTIVLFQYDNWGKYYGKTSRQVRTI
jgi:hypothetical protein